MLYFLNNGIICGVFVEPLAAPFKNLSARCCQIPNYVAVQTLCSDENGKACTFHVASNSGMNSSILKPIKHPKVFQDVRVDSSIEVVSTTVDDLTSFLSSNGYATVVEQLDVMYLDVGGAELMVLMGANYMLKRIKYLFTKIVREKLYEEQPDFLKLCCFLEGVGFVLNNVYFNRYHIGSALFVRKELL